MQHSISKPSTTQYQQTEHSTVSANQKQYSISKLNTAQYQQTEHSIVSANCFQILEFQQISGLLINAMTGKDT